jgi:hypothetical protein
MNARLAFARELAVLADLTDQYSRGEVLATHLWEQEARVHRAHAALYRGGGDSQEPLRRAVRALAGLDREFLIGTSPDAMQRVMEARGWTKHSEVPWPGDPSRVAFHVYDHPTALGDPGGVTPAVRVPQDPDAADYPHRVIDWASAVAHRHGDVAPAEVLAEVWGAT